MNRASRVIGSATQEDYDFSGSSPHWEKSSDALGGDDDLSASGGPPPQDAESFQHGISQNAQFVAADTPSDYDQLARDRDDYERSKHLMSSEQRARKEAEFEKREADLGGVSDAMISATEGRDEEDLFDSGTPA